MAAGDHAQLISAVSKYGDASRGGDPQLWADVLQHFVEQPGSSCEPQVWCSTADALLGWCGVHTGAGARQPSVHEGAELGNVGYNSACMLEGGGVMHISTCKGHATAGVGCCLLAG